ncbi:Abhydrolase-3 domain-containing protein [Fusarium sp. LHS14.1]|nr:Abhydrolase-3 domain-containing protein [Fusarium sp. LHS14.1]
MLIIEQFNYQSTCYRSDKVAHLSSMAPTVDDPETWHEFALQDPELKQMLDSGVKPRFWNDGKLSSLPGTRERYHGVFLGDADKVRQDAGDSVYEKEISIPVRDGASIGALVYGPRNGPEGGNPLAIFIHGGGFILGIAEMETPPCIAVAKAYGCICVSLDYRLSLEVKFLTAYEDCWDAIIWLSKNAASLGADPTKGFILGGTSAGGHISIPLSHRARDESLSPPLTGVYLGVTPSLPPQALNPQARPFLPKSRGPQGRPDANVQVNGFHGTKTRVIVYPGLPHIFWYNYPSHSAAKNYVDDTCVALGWLLGHET